MKFKALSENVIMKTLTLLLLLTAAAFSGTKAHAQAFTTPVSEEGMYVTPGIANMFPNPAMNQTTVVLNYLPGNPVYVELVDFNGNIRRSYAFTAGGQQLSFDVSFLERGLYVVRVREASRLVDMVKLVKS
jgi:hypothetical protein